MLMTYLYDCPPLLPVQSSVDELQSQFSAYEQSQEQVEHILQHWDRAQGLLLVPLPSEEGPPEDPSTEKRVSCFFSIIKLRLLGKFRKSCYFTKSSSPLK